MYYKYYDENKILILGENDYIPAGTVEISEEEYNSEIEKLKASAAEEAEAAEQSKDNRIAELEVENAALLYQVLTGEELADV